MLSLPSKFLQQHGGKIRDGLIVLKLVAGLGKIAGLPLSLEGMPTEVVSMARGLGRRSGLQFDLAAPSPRVPTPNPICRPLHEKGMGGAHCTLQSTRTGGGSSRQDVRRAARQRRLGRDGWALAKPGCNALKVSLARLKLGVVRELAYCSSYRQGLPRAEGSGGRSASPELQHTT